MNTKPFLSIALSFLLLSLTGCYGDDLTGAASSDLPLSSATTIPDVSGAWTWTESQTLVVSAELGFLWGLPAGYPDDPIHIACTSSGELELEQDGTTFTGVGSQESSCTTPDGELTPTVPFPQGDEALGIEGRITGRAIHFEALVGEGFYCPYNGSLRVSSGVATQIQASGRCEVPIEVRPLNGSGISFEAVR